MYACVWVTAVFSVAAFACHVWVAALPASGMPGWKMAKVSERKDDGIHVEEWRKAW